jgi:hypothetical protein
MEYSVATFTAVYRTNPVLLTFNILAFLYENPVLLARNYAGVKRSIKCLFLCLFVLDPTAPSGPGPPHSRGF